MPLVKGGLINIVRESFQNLLLSQLPMYFVSGMSLNHIIQCLHNTYHPIPLLECIGQ